MGTNRRGPRPQGGAAAKAAPATRAIPTAKATRAAPPAKGARVAPAKAPRLRVASLARRRGLALALTLLLAACGATPRYATAPAHLDDACRILDQRPAYLRAFRATERRWGVPVAVQMAIIYQESKFDADARPPHRFALGVIPMGRQSSALGYSQALDGTWAEYQAEMGRGSRENISDATDFMGWYMNLTAQELGIPLHDTERQYLAYHEGRTGYRNESYLEKAWLMEVAAGLAGRAAMYQRQLQDCRRA
jgi:hypothetical protein